MSDLVVAGNLALRFAVEMAALVALGVWGAHVSGSQRARRMLAVLTPAAAATVWAVFASPGAPVSLGPGVTIAIQAVVLGSAAAALVAVRRPRWALSFVVVACLNALMLEAGQ
ncbi:MAG TPA: YrdB family protein [Nocardioides sp.]|nr:YrdB family protein [Nocardioides sp.]